MIFMLQNEEAPTSTSGDRTSLQTNITLRMWCCAYTRKNK